MELDRLFLTLPLGLVRTLLLAVVRRLEGGLTELQVEEFCAELTSLDDDDDLLIEPLVVLNAQTLPFVVDVFAEQAVDLEVVFILPPILTKLVQEEVAKVCGVVPHRLIPAESQDSR